MCENGKTPYNLFKGYEIVGEGENVKAVFTRAHCFPSTVRVIRDDIVHVETTLPEKTVTFHPNGMLGLGMNRKMAPAGHTVKDHMMFEKARAEVRERYRSRPLVIN